ncbi:MAG: hypothetical protein DI546_05850 [Rhizobium sp.]|nr:MAG: hypothetical protein DI546_05850 [Rhizobium sp.]
MGVAEAERMAELVNEGQLGVIAVGGIAVIALGGAEPTIYQSLFGRAPDAGGLDFFSKGLANGTLKLETLAINILDGAQGSDKSIVDNKTAAADLFTKSLDTPAEIAAYNGNAAAELGRTFLTKVTDDKTTIPSQTDVDKAVAGVVTPSGGQGPAEGGSTGGGSNPSTPTGPTLESFTVTHKNGNIANVAANDKLFAGGGNLATGMQIATAKGDNKIIELALDARYSKDAADIVPTSTDQNVATYTMTAGSAARFAYSVGIGPETGSNNLKLDAYDYKLLIDTNSSSATNYVELSLLRNESGNPTTNVSNSPYEWFKGSDVAIKDDGGTESVSQNIEALQWFNGGNNLKAGDQYDVKLQAFHKGTTTMIAETAIKIVGAIDGHLSDAASYQTNELFAGSGNSNSNFATTRLSTSTGTIELGLNGRVAYGDVKAGTLGSDGLVHFEMNSSEAARFAYSISSSEKLSNYTFKLKVDTDKGAGDPVYTEFVLANRTDEIAGHTKNHNGTTDSAYVWKLGSTSIIVDDGGDAQGKVTQNVEPFSLGVLQPGQYDVVLEAYQGATLIGTNHVVFDITGLDPS